MAFFSESGGWYLNAFFLMASRGQKESIRKISIMLKKIFLNQSTLSVMTLFNTAWCSFSQLWFDIE